MDIENAARIVEECGDSNIRLGERLRSLQESRRLLDNEILMVQSEMEMNSLRIQHEKAKVFADVVTRHQAGVRDGDDPTVIEGKLRRLRDALADGRTDPAHFSQLQRELQQKERP